MTTKTATAKKNGTETKGQPNKKATPAPTPSKPSPNGAEKKDPKDVTVKLAQNALGQPAIISIEERMTAFDQLTGLANQRTRLKSKLDELNKFVFNNGENCEFSVKDEEGKTFKTSNNNLITLVTGILKTTLEERKGEIEEQIVHFQL